MPPAAEIWKHGAEMYMSDWSWCLLLGTRNCALLTEVGVVEKTIILPVIIQSGVSHDFREN
jgi:hypothetical protein